MIRLFGLVSLLLLTAIPLAATEVTGKTMYAGHYWNEDRSGIFELRLTEQSIKGVTVWGKDPKTDMHNPKPELRDRSLAGIEFLWGFTYEAKKNRWSDGKVYDPDNGKTYEAKMSLEREGTILKMRGFIGVSLFGRTARFERVDAGEFPADMAEPSTE